MPAIQPTPIDDILAKTYCTRAEAVRLTEISTRTLTRETERGNLPLYRVGSSRAYRYKVQDVLALVHRVA